MERSKMSRRRVRQTDEGELAIADFLDVAGHELRAPLTSLKGHAQILQRRLAKQLDREADSAEVSKMLYQISRLEHELDVYLEAARLFGGRFALQVEQVDLAGLARRLVELQNRGAADDVLQLEAPEGELIGEWDRRKIQIALGALLSNAAKFGLGGDAVLRLSATDGGVRVEVEDQGIGVPLSERKGIFGAYVTGGNVRNAGLGLGLYVAREIVRWHGGRIGMRGRRGGGSLFWFELPLTVSASDRNTPSTHDREMHAAAHTASRAESSA